MAMLAGQMLMQPEVRKGIGKLAKYLLIFGGLGVGILAFILIAKKFDPFKAVGSFFGKAFKGVNDFIGNILGGVGSGVGGLLKGASGLLGGVLPIAVPEVIPYEKGGVQWYGGASKEDEQMRREFRRYAVVVTRQLEDLKKIEGLPKEVAGRISMVASAFKRVDKKFVRDIPKQFEVIWSRKRAFLRSNLEKGFKKAEMIAIAKKYAKKGMVGASKLTLMEMRGMR